MIFIVFSFNICSVIDILTIIFLWVQQKAVSTDLDQAEGNVLRIFIFSSFYIPEQVHNGKKDWPSLVGVVFSTFWKLAEEEQTERTSGLEARSIMTGHFTAYATKDFLACCRKVWGTRDRNGQRMMASMIVQAWNETKHLEVTMTTATL